jgi:hypothetical protein
VEGYLIVTPHRFRRGQRRSGARARRGKLYADLAPQLDSFINAMRLEVLKREPCVVFRQIIRVLDGAMIDHDMAQLNVTARIPYRRFCQDALGFCLLVPKMFPLGLMVGDEVAWVK